MKDFIESICTIVVAVFLLMYVVAFVENSITMTKNLVDSFINGSPRFKEGYIPIKERKYPNIKVVPPGANREDYVISPKSD